MKLPLRVLPEAAAHITRHPVCGSIREGVQRGPSLWQGAWGMRPQIEKQPRVGGREEATSCIELVSERGNLVGTYGAHPKTLKQPPRGWYAIIVDIL